MAAVVVMTLGGQRWQSGAVKRVLTAVVAVPLFAWLVSRGPAWLFVALVLAVGALAVWELMRMFEGAGQPVYPGLAVALTILVLTTFATGSFSAQTAALCLAIGLLLSAPAFSRRPPATEPAALTLAGVLYIGWFLGHSVALYRLAEGPELILLLAGVTWVGESAAYLIGSAIGRHKLAATISPRKTLEGAAAQLVGSALGALILATWLTPQWPWSRALLAGALVGVVGQVGDLAESAMKRAVGVKDTGGLIPGHGGVLDRVDGLLFNVPAFYYYVLLTGRA